MKTDNVCIAVCGSLEVAQAGMAELQKAGFAVGKISLVGKDHPEDQQIHGYHTTGETMKFWGKQGAVWGSVMGVLAASGMIFVPGIGPLLAAGPIVSILVGGAEGAVVLGGIEALFAGFAHLALSKDSLALYDKQLKQGHWLLLAHGDVSEVMQAKEILEQTDCEQVDVHCES